MEEEEEEDKSENPVDLTIDSIQWILSQNVRAGTLAMFWCLKSQVFKVKARYKYDAELFLLGVCLA